MARRGWCSHQAAGYLSEILKYSKDILTAKQAICLQTSSGNSYIVVLGLVIQYSLGEGTFSGWPSPRVIVSYSNTGGGVVGRLGRTTDDHRSHANTLLEDTILTPRIDCFTLLHTQR